MDFETVAALHRAYKQVTVDPEIHPEDTMYRTGKEHYTYVGESAVDIILSALALSWVTEVNRILDMACGHGRVARHLRAAFPKAELFFCDLDAGAADFCADRFRGTSIPSVEKLTAVPLPEKLDLIWVGSLFTHIDRVRTADWLSHLVQHLRTNGILVGTFHGYFTEKVTTFGDRIDKDKLSHDFLTTGYGYCCYKGWNDYGVSLSKPSAVLDIAGSIPGTKVLSYTERGWANNHDVLALAKTDRLKPWGS